jgi:hypothetical protein
VIAASRGFINVRLNIWLDEINFMRLHALIGNKFSGKELTANTAFCLFEPNAEGLTAQSFPGEASVFFGSRVGCLYPNCISTTMDPANGDDRKYRVSFIQKRRLADLGEGKVSSTLLERIIWERENGADGPGLAKIMRNLSARFPTSKSSTSGAAHLPLMPNLRQALNFGATDCRAVVALVVPEAGNEAMSKHLSRLLFEQGIAGRVHLVRMSASEWAEAKAASIITGGEHPSGIMFVHPTPFGRSGQVHGETQPEASEQQVRQGLIHGLESFMKMWRKPDYFSHLKEGFARSITWREWDPVSKSMADLAPQISPKGPRAKRNVSPTTPAGDRHK